MILSENRFPLFGIMLQLIPRDDLAFTSIDGRRVEQVAATPPHQEAGTPCIDDVAPSPARGRISPVVGELRKRQDLAPGLPCGVALSDIIGHQKGNGERGIAVKQNERSPVGGVAHGHAGEFADAHADRHLHATDGAMQRHAFAMKFDLPDAAVGAAVARGETDGQ